MMTTNEQSFTEAFQSIINVLREDQELILVNYDTPVITPEDPMRIPPSLLNLSNVCLMRSVGISMVT